MPAIDLAALRQKRAQHVDAMESLVAKATNDNRDMSEAEATAYDEFKGEVAGLDSQIKRAEEVQKLKAELLTPPPANRDNPTGTPGAPAVRRSTSGGERRASNDDDPEQKGLGFARIVRCLVAGKGNPFHAAEFAQRHFGDAEVAKALTAGDGSAGGFLVPANYSAEIIELLRARAVLRRAGAKVIPMSGSVDIPRMTGGTQAGYVGENQNATKTEPTFGNLKAVERKLAAIVPISNDLIRLSSPKADQLVRDDLIASMAVTEDSYFLRGAGTGNAPKGIRNWANSANVTGSAGTSAANIETDLKNLIQALEGNNVMMIQPVWIMSPRSKNALWVLRDNGNLVFPEIRDGKLWGYPVHVTNQVPTSLGGGSESEIYFADMSDVVIAENETIAIDVSDTAAYHDGSAVVAAFSQDQTVIRAIARHDLVVRHDYSVAVKTGVAY